MRLSPLLLIVLLTACGGATSSTTNPNLVEYSKEFQAKAADEMQVMKPPCAHDVVDENCSASRRMIIDYKDMREKIRAATQRAFEIFGFRV